MIKTYDLIKELLTDYPELRDSDKKLMWRVWNELGFILRDGREWIPDFINKDDFMKAPSTETIRRCRQKIQELHPELRSSKEVQKMKDKKEASKSTFVYRDEVSFSETIKEQMQLI